MIAKIGDTVIAQSDETILIEGNHYFPPSSVNMEFFSEKTDLHTTCPWKGEADYYNVVISGDVLENVAWTYSQPKPAAIERVKHDFSNYIAFYPQIEVTKEQE